MRKLLKVIRDMLFGFTNRDSLHITIEIFPRERGKNGKPDIYGRQSFIKYTRIKDGAIVMAVKEPIDEEEIREMDNILKKADYRKRKRDENKKEME